MAEQAIHTFIGGIIAIYRPRKQTYNFLRWQGIDRFWTAYDIPHPPEQLTLHRTVAHTGLWAVNIKVNNTHVHVKSDRSFLLLRRPGEPVRNIPILTTQHTSRIPAYCKKTEYTYGPNPITELDVPLWSLAPVQPVAPVAPVQPVEHIRTVLEPIPKRIAWLIADNACKENEMCSITMEHITPLTAAVTTCFHCFEAEAVGIWLSTKSTCPTCRKPCLTTKAFEAENL